MSTASLLQLPQQQQRSNHPTTSTSRLQRQFYLPQGGCFSSVQQSAMSTASLLQSQQQQRSNQPTTATTRLQRQFYLPQGGMFQLSTAISYEYSFSATSTAAAAAIKS